MLGFARIYDQGLKLQLERQQMAEKVHGLHADFCPVARSIKGSILIGLMKEENSK
jgi:organic hydroperoxide reductase OsmC/OhrA